MTDEASRACGRPADGSEAGGDATSAYDLFRRGTAFLESGHPGQAAELLARAARMAPAKNSIREALARSYFAMGRFDRAAAEFEHICEAVPTNDYAQFGLGCSLLNLGRPVAARGRLRLATAMNPDRDEYAQRLVEAERLVAADDPGAEGAAPSD